MLISPIVLGGNLPGIIDPESVADRPYLPDFSYAGYRNGLTPVPAATGRIINVAEHGAKPDDGVDDSAAVIAAVAAAGKVAGPVRIRFAPGRYRITEIIRIGRGDIVLQGAGSGAGGTVLEFPLPLAQVDSGTSFEEIRKYLREHDKRQVQPELNIDSYFSEYSWTGGFIWIQKPATHAASYLPEYDPPIRVLVDVAAGRRGEHTLRLKSTSSLRKDDVVQLQWTNSFGPDAKLIDAMYDDPDIEVGSHHWSFPDRPLVRQSTRIVAVDGLQLTIADPLLHDISDEIPAAIAEWDHLENVGIEDLHFEFPVAPYFGHHMERGYNGIYLTSAFDSWVRNVRFTNADSGILSYNSANVTLQDITSDGSRVAHYGVHMGNVHNVLAERVIVLSPVYHSLTFNTQSTKCVYKDALVMNSAVLDQHAGSNHQNLYDNVTLHIAAQPSKEGPVAKVFDGSGAGYWQPGHGAFNTTWNLNVLITSGAYSDETVTVQGLDEGPGARIIGLHGNRRFKLDYRPAPYIEALNERVAAVPSLYDYQLML
ncbi:MAG: glycosyl hydrolase family 28-related protein, partial [Woeseia sp.]